MDVRLASAASSVGGCAPSWKKISDRKIHHEALGKDNLLRKPPASLLFGVGVGPGPRRACPHADRHGVASHDFHLWDERTAHAHVCGKIDCHPHYGTHVPYERDRFSSGPL